ncbi:MAG: glucosamine-6-phosphate deaminase [Kiritimatiellae bacterium]|nr:glucosamine-6-phosphate deaminase [Kiritimatiellia bacterium]
MEVIIQPTADAACDLVSRMIAKTIRAKPHLVMGLATGRTMETLYGKLANMHKKEGLDFSLCRTFNLDEYVGLPPTHEGSYRYYMNHHLFSKVNIDLRCTHLPIGTANDLDAECRRYEQHIQEIGGIDLQLLGLGKSGHIGFNEPLSALRSRTRVKSLTSTTIAENCTLFNDPKSMPHRAITMGVGTILESRRIIMLVTGKAKAEVLAAAVEGPITAMISASAIQLHPTCTVVVDEGAASQLKGVEYYRWIFENEPEWQEYH